MTLIFRETGRYQYNVYYNIDLNRINQIMKEHYNMNEVGNVTEEDIYNCMNNNYNERGYIYIENKQFYFDILYDIICEYKEWSEEELLDQEMTDEEFLDII